MSNTSTQVACLKIDFHKICLQRVKKCRYAVLARIITKRTADDILLLAVLNYINSDRSKIFLIKYDSCNNLLFKLSRFLGDRL